MKQKFEGWVSEEEYDRWTAEVAEQDRQNLLHYQQQMREQRPGMFIDGWKLLKFFAEVALGSALIVGIGWFIWQFIEALPRFIEVWQ